MEVLPQHNVEEDMMMQTGQESQDSGVDVPCNELAVDDAGSNTLQHLHNLIQTLNPKEREVFLRTHNFFNNVGSGSPSRRRGDDGGRGEVPSCQQRSPTQSTIGKQGQRVMLPLQQQPSPGSRSAPEIRTGIRRDSAADGMDSRGKEGMPEDRTCELTEQQHQRSQHTGNMQGGGTEKAASLQMERGAVAKGAPHPTTSKAEELQEMLQRVDNLRRELEATEECRIEGGMSHVKWGKKNQQWAMLPDEAAFQHLATKSKNPAGQQKKRSALPAVDSKSLLTSGGHNNFQRTMQKEDALGLPWAAVQDVPPLEITRLGSPCGPFWDHMRPFLYDRGAYVFPWHLNWNEQCPELKARFIYRLRQLYPGAWEAKEVLAQLGNSLRERRNRLKKRFKIYSNPKAVPRPKGCTLESWEQIYRDLRDPKKMAKASLCKVKADERVALAVYPFSHRCGRGGYRAIVARFVSLL